MKNTKQKLVLEVNQKFVDGDKNIFKFGNSTVMVTPPLDEDYWQFRVMVDKDQAIVGFPKFSSIGIGFAKEDDWNTNLPSDTPTNELWNHIKRNKYFASIPDDVCIRAIKMVQKAAGEFFRAQKEMEDTLVFGNEPFLKSETTGNFITKKEFQENCQVLRARRTTEFTSSFFGKTTEIKMRKFCLLFGYSKEQHSYKYKFTLYETTTDKAIGRFMYLLRQLNLNFDVFYKQFETMQIANAENERGFKIPICF